MRTIEMMLELRGLANALMTANKPTCAKLLNKAIEDVDYLIKKNEELMAEDLFKANTIVMLQDELDLRVSTDRLKDGKVVAPPVEFDEFPDVDSLMADLKDDDPVEWVGDETVKLSTPHDEDFPKLEEGELTLPEIEMIINYFLDGREIDIILNRYPDHVT